MMKMAEELYSYKTTKTIAERECISKEIRHKRGVEYTDYLFKDGSKLSLGSNGYIGYEVP